MHTPDSTEDQSSSLRVVVVIVGAVVVARSGTAAGQTTSPPSIFANSPEVGSSLTADTIANLPLAENVYSLLETTQSEVISDRFNASGLNVGENSRVGGFLGSWSQTSFRIGDIDMTDPSGSGAPLLFPELIWWDRVTVCDRVMPTISTPRARGHPHPRAARGRLEHDGPRLFLREAAFRRPHRAAPCRQSPD